MSERLLHGWGRVAPSRAVVVRPADTDAVRELAAGANGRPLIARGLGRSYGDAAQSAAGLVLDMRARNRWLRVDVEHGLVRTGAGTSLGEIGTALAGTGWSLPVLPGTRHVTVGGAIASDVHGKNHEVRGSFARHVESMVLVDGTGTVHRLTPHGNNDELFRATTGGMGLTGVVTEAAVRLVPVPSPWVRVRESAEPDLDAVLAALAANTAGSTDTVAWVDVLGFPRHGGRGVVSSAEPMAAAEVAPDRELPRQGAVPVSAVPPVVLNRHSIRAYNALRWARARGRARTARAAGPENLQPSPAVVALEQFNHPLDGLSGWNRLYGRGGLVQYQFVVPESATDVLRNVLRSLSVRRVPCYLAVLKRLGDGTGAPLSFPVRGWTLALDFPGSAPGLRGALDRCDGLVAAAGGRVYLTKDVRLRADVLPAMYPGLAAWQRIRDRYDPAGRFASDLSRRLGLTGGR